LRFARLHYDLDVHTPYLGFRETANLTSEEVLDLVITENEMTHVDKEYTTSYFYNIFRYLIVLYYFHVLLIYTYLGRAILSKL